MRHGGDVGERRQTATEDRQAEVPGAMSERRGGDRQKTTGSTSDRTLRSFRIKPLVKKTDALGNPYTTA